ncbi:MAG: hypothetical protein DMF78_02070 [Acidobacteria bacterium]|nr:MAG: hypothetical protein DMF78_02070 [Acidobacteriota bacterium]
MKAEVRVRLRKGRPTRFEVGPAGVVLGREGSAAVAIPLDGVSREHARIEWDGKGWEIEDLKSTNGTFVNGERVSRERLQHLDVISLGRKADLVFVLRSPQEAAPAREGIVRAALVDSDGAVKEIAAGEFTLGRSAACNLVADLSAISKVHARLARSSDQLLVEDLGSSNGTFVNGTRVRTAVLRDGDTLELARVVQFKVVVEQGDVRGSGVYRTPTLAKPEAPQFSEEWKTRYEWGSGEMEAIAAAVAGVRPAELPKRSGKTGPIAATSKDAAPRAPHAAPAAKAAGPAVPPPARTPAPGGRRTLAEAAAGIPPSAAAAGATAPPSAAAPAPPPASRGGSPTPTPPPPAPSVAPPVTSPPVSPPSAAMPHPAPAARLTAGTLAFAIEAPGRYEMGRATTVNFRVDHTTVSRRHAAVTLADDGTLVAEDLGAANGTRVNGREIEGAQALDNGDVLQLGEVSFTVALRRG